MATKRRKPKKNIRHQQRRKIPVSLRRWRLLLGSPLERLPKTQQEPVKKQRSEQKLLQDRRFLRYKKEPLRYGKKDQIARTRLRERTILGKHYKITPRQGFIDAKRQEICQRRARRRMRLFQMGKAGKGRAIRTAKKITEYSRIRCK